MNSLLGFIENLKFNPEYTSYELIKWLALNIFGRGAKYNFLSWFSCNFWKLVSIL